MSKQNFIKRLERICGVKIITIDHKRGNQRFIIQDKDGKTLCGSEDEPVTLESIKEWIRKSGLKIHLKNKPRDYDGDVEYMPLGLAHQRDPDFCPWTFKYDYIVTENGQIINSAGYKFMKQYVDSTRTHKYVCLAVNDDTISAVKISVHRAVAFFFCPNSKRKNVVHHIDENYSNNKKNNLICVTPAEHSELHSILRQRDTKKYYSRIAEIMCDNEEPAEGEV